MEIEWGSPKHRNSEACILHQANLIDSQVKLLADDQMQRNSPMKTGRLCMMQMLEKKGQYFR
jgi:hypothetical protein